MTMKDKHKYHKTSDWSSWLLAVKIVFLMPSLYLRPSIYVGPGFNQIILKSLIFVTNVLAHGITEG